MGERAQENGGTRGKDRLTDRACRLARPGAGIVKLSDGKGLYLAVKPSGAKIWRVKYRAKGIEKTYTIGAFPEVGLAEARAKRDEARGWLLAGLNPTVQKKVTSVAAGDVQAATFRRLAAEYIAAQNFSAAHVEALTRILERDLHPAIGDLPIAGGITTPDALAALRTIEARGQLETCAKARRLGSQIHRYAIATGCATTDPFASLARGVLRPPVVVNRVTVPLKEFPALLKALHAVPAEASTKLACYFTLLTAARVGEVRFATWGELDRDWIIPAARMKMKRDHQVPLAKQAKEILAQARTLRTSDAPSALLFPGFTRHGALSENALIALLARCGYYGRQTMHGMRAAFSTWAHEHAEAPADVIEASLAHVVPGVRGKYNRSVYLPQRRALLQAWADQCSAWGMRL